MWSSINVFQYQQLFPVLKIKDVTEQNSRLIAIVNGWTENEVDSLSVQDYNNEKKKLSFLNDEIGGNPVKYIKVNGRRYKCVYDVRKLPSGRYIESKVFAADFVENLHKLAASMVLPMKKTIFGWRVTKYDASKHEEYATDMQSAKITDIYNSVVFFYHVYRNWMEVSKVYLMEVLMKTGKDWKQAEAEVQNLLNIMDGNIAPRMLPTTKILKLMKLMNSPSFSTLTH
jgi:hypothetical protein